MQERFLCPQQRALPGILGGLGPLAHIEFERRLLQHSFRRGATRDQEHPTWLLLNATSTPDRTQSLLAQGPDCTPALVHGARLLETMGASFLVVTCNTAHAFHGVVQSQLSIPWLHMMDATAAYIAQNFPSVHQVGILATDGTVKSQLYDGSLRRHHLFPVVPQLKSPLQQRVMRSIYDPDWGVKSTGTWVSDLALSELTTAVDGLVEQGAELVIAGCTEISVGLARCNTLSINWIDPLDVMAEAVLDLAYGVRPTQSTLAA
ncbi:MAG: amino acid racemase [Cyanobacteria bacterium J06632_22]